MKLYPTIVALCLSVSGYAQQVPKTVVVEHFTNSFCSVCAANNPGFYNNLQQFPGVLHISYYPSSPYAACPLSQQNKPEQDARTNHYGIYGATPRLVVQGDVLPSGNLNDPAIFQSRLGQTSSFAMQVSVSSQGDTSIVVTTVIKKVDTSSLSNLQLYGVVAEDTLFFAANNGETIHYDVFRRSVFGTEALPITAPQNVGDSSIYTQTVSLTGAWNIHRANATVLLQETDNSLVQAGRSGKLETGMGLQNIPASSAITFYPNPAGYNLYVSNAVFPVKGSILSISGQVLSEFSIGDMYSPINVSALRVGVYFIRMEHDGRVTYTRFVKG